MVLSSRRGCACFAFTSCVDVHVLPEPIMYGDVELSDEDIFRGKGVIVFVIDAQVRVVGVTVAQGGCSLPIRWTGQAVQWSD
jgi:hypothetical protein